MGCGWKEGRSLACHTTAHSWGPDAKLFPDNLLLGPDFVAEQFPRCNLLKAFDINFLFKDIPLR